MICLLPLLMLAQSTPTADEIMARVADEIVAFCAPGSANHSSVDASPGKTS